MNNKPRVSDTETPDPSFLCLHHPWGSRTLWIQPVEWEKEVERHTSSQSLWSERTTWVHAPDGPLSRDLPRRQGELGDVEPGWAASWRRLCSMEGKHGCVVGLCHSLTNGWVCSNLAQSHHHLSFPEWPRKHWNSWLKLKAVVSDCEEERKEVDSL